LQKDLKRVQRLVKILQLIDGGQIGRLDLASKFGVTERQIYRDINDLVAAKFPITYNKRTSAYSFIEGFSLKRIALSPDELQAIMLSREIFSALGGVFADKMAKFLLRLMTEVKTKPAGAGFPVSFTLDPPVDFSRIASQYNALLQAINESCMVKIIHGDKDGCALEREVDPYRLFYSCGFWYLLGFCRLRNDIRTFALDKIEKVTILDKRFAVRQDFDFDSYMAACWKNFFLGEPEDITIRFSPQAAGQIKRKKWHPSQKITENDDGSIDFTVTIAGQDEIMKWILSWGGEARVAAPKELQEKVRAAARRMAKG
jgi:predicted DNA-binding transcriptional regulator YafY